MFAAGPYFDIVLDSLRHLRDSRGLAVHAYVIMPTHMHAILSAGQDDLSDVIRDFKRFTSREMLEQSDRDGNRLQSWVFRNPSIKDSRAKSKVWQDEFHPEVVFSQDFFLEKAGYLHTNPVRKGLVADAVSYYYSSALAFETGRMEPLEIDWLEW